MRAGFIVIGLVCIIYFTQVDSKEVTPASEQITVTLNSEVELKWTISSDIKINETRVYLNTKGIANKIIRGAGYVSDNGKKRFGDRISAELKNNEVVVKIQKVQLNETNSVFIIDVLEFISAADNTSFRGKISENSEIKLIVLGGPIFCADQIPATRSYNENTTPSISVTLCGIPKPAVTWQFDSNILSGGVSTNSTSQSHGYDYYIALPNFTPSMCGKQLLLQADGYSGKVTATSTLDIKFTPASITDVRFYKTDTCNQVTWLPLYTGNCNVTYTVQYTNCSGSIIATKNNLVQTSHCESFSSEVSSVKVWATYNGKQGPAGSRTHLQIVTPITTTTTAMTTTTENANNKALEADTFYTVFIRVYVTDDV